jgi:hypothetical protein
MCFKFIPSSPGAVAQACSPNYSGGGDREDQGSRPAQVKGSQDPILIDQSCVWWCMPNIPARQEA